MKTGTLRLTVARDGAREDAEADGAEDWAEIFKATR